MYLLSEQDRDNFEGQQEKYELFRPFELEIPESQTPESLNYKTLYCLLRLSGSERWDEFYNSSDFVTISGVDMSERDCFRFGSFKENDFEKHWTNIDIPFGARIVECKTG